MATRLLLIDDNLPDRVRYRRMLQRETEAFDIVEASDGSSGLAALAQQGPFDCVLLDQELPDMQGLDVLVDIRARPNPPPVVMLTGEEDAAISIDALRRGAADYLMKRRIDEDRLQRAVRGAIQRHLLSHRVQEHEQRLALFYRLANQTEDALLIIEAGSLKIIECNEAARFQLQVKPGQDGHAAPPAAFESAAQWQAFCQRAQAEGSASHEWNIPRSDGDSTAIEILARHVEEDGRPYLVAVGRDITLRKQRERELLERSLRDGLTGVWNRRAFDERLAEYWRNAARRQRPLAVVMLDVDHFKAYNDSLGHPAGDECLRQVALGLKNGLLRGSGMLARYGGEEFVALLDETDAEGGRVVAERLRLVVLGMRLPHPQSSAGAAVSISVGVASCIPADGTGSQSLMVSADDALYRAKQSGRNRVVVS
ncbi:MAG: diguanylate cyclase [Pseudomonadota bacterium]